MQKFDDMVDIVFAHLKEHDYCETVIKQEHRCFEGLKFYLEQNTLPYTPKEAERWYESISDSMCETCRAPFRVALTRLQDIYENGSIRPIHDYKAPTAYSCLNDGLRNDLKLFLANLSGTMAEATVRNYRCYCSKFFLHVQQTSEKEKVSSISYEDIITFFEVNDYGGKWVNQIRSCVSHMMLFFYRKGDVPYGFSRIFHYLYDGKGCYWNQVSSETHNNINELMAATSTVDVRRLVGYQQALSKLHLEQEYSKSIRTSYKKITDLLIMFLEMNGYRYNPEIAMLWFNDIFGDPDRKYHVFKRGLNLIGQYHAEGEFRLATMFLNKRSKFQLLPEWCRPAAERYVAVKTKEGWAHSTLDMIRSSICRFCNYLDGTGIRSFDAVTADDIKQFNLHDGHKTPEGKNAYNSRIKRFLFFLGEHGYLRNPMLFTALTTVCAPKETIVVVLTETEMEQINEEISREDSILSLRKKAMLLLGLKMGIRSSDIVKLRIDNINWNEASIRFIQDKTSVEVDLPMPTEVGNALFRYITEERHKKSHTQIFLSEKAPYRPVKRGSCGRALNTALADRNIPGSGFHVTRKTYATALLNNGVSCDMVAEALGQHGTDSVHRYLSLDSPRMKMCPLSLEDCGIRGWQP